MQKPNLPNRNKYTEINQTKQQTTTTGTGNERATARSIKRNFNSETHNLVITLFCRSPHSVLLCLTLNNWPEMLFCLWFKFNDKSILYYWGFFLTEKAKV